MARGGGVRWLGASVGGTATDAVTAGRRPRAGPGDEHGYKVRQAYQLTRWSSTYSGAGAGVSSQCNGAACSHSGGPRARATSGGTVGTHGCGVTHFPSTLPRCAPLHPGIGSDQASHLGLQEHSGANVPFDRPLPEAVLGSGHSSECPLWRLAAGSCRPTAVVHEHPLSGTSVSHGFALPPFIDAAYRAPRPGLRYSTTRARVASSTSAYSGARSSSSTAGRAV
jgi:hypothetical protein